MSYDEISTSYPAGKKAYTCSWCGEVIPKGEKHLARFYRFEGNAQRDRLHLECESSMNSSSYDDICDGWTFGSMPRGKKPQTETVEVSK